MPPEERVTTGSEPRRWTLTYVPPYSAFVHRESGPILKPGEVVEVVEVVESGHDEQTEDARAEFERVVDFLNEQGVTLWGDDDPIYHGGHSMEALADAFEERFKPSAPGGDDGH